jgi:hypothetical protein
MSKQQKSKSQVAQFSAYQTENRQEKNKIKKLKRHVKNNPNDDLAYTGLSRIKKDGKSYARTVNGNRHKVSAADRKDLELEAMVKRVCSTGYIENRYIKEKKGDTIIRVAFANIGVNSGSVFKAMQAKISLG